MRKLFIGILAISLSLTAFLTACAATSSGVRIASWNVRHLGWDNGMNYQAVALVMSRFDFIAIQEVMDAEAAERIETRVEAITDEEWELLTSDPVGRSSYREGYAMLWRKREIEYLGGATLYIDRRDVFAREPMSAHFRTRDTGKAFVVATVHITYGDSIADRVPEIRALDDYWRWLGENYPDTPRILMGDFNMAPDHRAWREFDSLAEALIISGATTLSEDNGEYASLYDNIWIDDKVTGVSSAGIAHFPQWLGISHAQARDHISDHAPVYVVLGQAMVSTAPFPGVHAAPDGATDGRQPKVVCIDLNKAPVEQLTQLTHIGPSRAAAIIQGRPWESVEALVALEGIGEERMEDIQDQGLLCNP